MRALLLLAAGVLAPACGAATRVDLVAFGDYVVTQDDANAVIRNGAVAVDKGRIVAVGPAKDIRVSYRGATTLEGHDRVVLPGLVNGHGHAAMSLFRGVSDDIELIDWLRKYMFPLEVRFVDAGFGRVGTELACWEMIRGGTTTFLDMYYFPDAVAKAVEGCGLRALVAPTVIDQKSPDATDAEDSLRKAEDFVRRWKGRNNRILPMVSAHALYTVKPERLREIVGRARALGVPMGIHLAESKYEIEHSQQNYGATPITVLESIGFFTGGTTVGAHVIYPTQGEIEILAKHRVGAIHNPSSNMKISSGIAPITAMLKAGVPVGIGTDGPATNNDLDMFEEMRLAAYLAKVATMDPKVIPAPTALRMATRGGAEALGLGNEIGALMPGRRADLIQVSLDDAQLQPLYDVISHLVYVADASHVATVVVDGKLVMRERRILTLDTARVRKESAAIAAKIRAAVAETEK
jgi:5-methylthioadenosine/S-adenosylhomocysteine deaminase